MCLRLCKQFCCFNVEMDQLFIVENINNHMLLLFGWIVIFTISNFNILFQKIILTKSKKMAGQMVYSDSEMADMHYIYGRANG